MYEQVTFDYLPFDVHVIGLQKEYEYIRGDFCRLDRLLEVGGKTGIPWFSFVLVRTVVLFHCTGFYGTYRQSPL